MITADTIVLALQHMPIPALRQGAMPRQVYAAIQAQSHMPRLQGQQRTWYAGAWMGYGFHEDGFKAGRDAAQALLAADATP